MPAGFALPEVDSFFGGGPISLKVKSLLPLINRALNQFIGGFSAIKRLKCSSNKSRLIPLLRNHLFSCIISFLNASHRLIPSLLNLSSGVHIDCANFLSPRIVSISSKAFCGFKLGFSNSFQSSLRYSTSFFPLSLGLYTSTKGKNDSTSCSGLRVNTSLL